MKYRIEVYLRPYVNAYLTVDRAGYIAEVFDEDRTMVYKSGPSSEDCVRKDAVAFAEKQPKFESVEIVQSNPN